MFGIDGMISAGAEMAATAMNIAANRMMWIADRLDALRESVVKNSPYLEDKVVVYIGGQPGASKQQLYLLALTTAFGIVRQQPGAGLSSFNPFSGPRFGVLEIQYDAAANWVQCTLGYRTGTLGLAVDPLSFASLAGIPSTSTSAAPIGLTFGTLAVYNGPQDEVIGGSFDFIAPATSGVFGLPLPGIPTSRVAAGIPTLPFEGRVILTYAPRVVDPSPRRVFNTPIPTQPRSSNTSTVIPTPNPKPPGDNRSRGMVVGPPSAIRAVSIDAASKMLFNGTGDGSSTNSWTEWLVTLVTSALSDPTSFSKLLFPQPTTGPTGD